jgi:hypothetical protein
VIKRDILEGLSEKKGGFRRTRGVLIYEARTGIKYAPG